MLYFGYGANTCKLSMAARCPAATPLGKAVLPKHRLVFRTYADVVPCLHTEVEGALWDISAADERALDLLEGVPTYYIKNKVVVLHRGLRVRAMLYQMTDRRVVAPPYDTYEDLLRSGYEQFGILMEQLDRALAHSLQNETTDVMNQMKLW